MTKIIMKKKFVEVPLFLDHNVDKPIGWLKIESKYAKKLCTHDKNVNLYPGWHGDDLFEVSLCINTLHKKLK